MIIKLTLIGMAFVPLIIGEASENPTGNDTTTTRVGKFFGWLAVGGHSSAPLKPLLSTNRRWKGEFSLSLGRRPLIASAIELHYIKFRPKPHGSLLDLPPSSDGTPSTSHPSTATSTSGTTDETALDSTAETTPAATSALKLEDYEEITFDPVVEENRVRRDATLRGDVNKRGLKDGDESADDVDSTTVESSTIPEKLQEQEAHEENFVTLSPPMADASSHHNSYYVPSYDKYPYPPSRYPSVQHVSITHSPPPKPYLPPPPLVKNYYDFYPSQPDYNFVPYCINSIRHKFTPIVHDAWSNYRKWT